MASYRLLGRGGTGVANVELVARVSSGSGGPLRTVECGALILSLARKIYRLAKATPARHTPRRPGKREMGTKFVSRHDQAD